MRKILHKIQPQSTFLGQNSRHILSYKHRDGRTDIARFLTIENGPIWVGHSVIAGVGIGYLKY